MSSPSDPDLRPDRSAAPAPAPADRAFSPEEDGGDEDDAALLAAASDYVREHGHGAARDLLDRLARGGDTLSPGTLVGPYALETKLGEGGMGVVFRARQREPIERTVAIKLIKPGMDSRAIIQRFASERQALARMDHPNIARVIDAGATEAGRLYFVMEHVEGVSLIDHCDARGLGVRPRLQLFQQVCRAVQHAHQRGVIHRDLKPSNVLVVGGPTGATAKVIDFGLAKAVGAGDGDTDAPALTCAGTPLGTLEYMSPEQAGQGAGAVDTRTDVYSLGVILYRLLAGAMPFDRERLRDTSFEQALRILQHEEPPRPSSRLAGASGSGAVEARQIRGDLDWIVLRALEKDPSRRYQTAAALADDVERHLRLEPVEAGPPSVTYRLSRLIRRRRALFGAISGIAAALVAGLVFAGHFYFQAQVDRVAKARADHSAGQLFSYLLRLLNSTMRAGGDSAQTSLLDVVSRETSAMGQHFSDDPVSEALLRGTFGRLLQTAGLLPDAEREYHVARALLDRGDDARVPSWTDREELALQRQEIVRNHARLLLKLERPREAEDLLLDELRRMDDPTVPAPIQRRARLTGLLAQALDTQGRHGEAGARLDEMLGLTAGVLEEDHEDQIALRQDLARHQLAVGRVDDALAEMEAGVEVRRARGPEGRSRRRLAVMLRELGDAYVLARRFEDAEAALQESHELLEADLGGAHQLTQEAVQVVLDLYDTWGTDDAAVRRAAWLPRRSRAHGEGSAAAPARPTRRR